jgi:putative ABC transport system ATP-binding protein
VIKLSVDTRDGSIVRLENVSRDYGGAQVVSALRNVTLSIGRGERVAFIGPSGSGKSTLLNLICGLDEATSGVVMFEGVDLTKLDDDSRTRLRSEKIGMIFQSFNLLPTLSAVENVSLPLRLRGVGRRDADKSAAAMLGRVGLKARAVHRPDEMSGGERQRVAIARALILRPPLLLADEPTGNLDSATGGEILTLLDALHREYGTTILLVTHNELAAANCGRVLTMRDGMIVKEDRKESFASEAR